MFTLYLYFFLKDISKVDYPMAETIFLYLNTVLSSPSTIVDARIALFQR